MELKVCEHFLELLCKRLPSFEKDSVDEILLEYIDSFICDLSTEDDISDIDASEFKEMLEGYVPDASVLSEFELIDLISQTCTKLMPIGQPSIKDEKMSLIPMVLEKKKKPASLSESSNGESCSSRISESSDVETIAVCNDNPELQILKEMFPDVLRLELLHCLSFSNGNLENAVQMVLFRQESGETFKEEQFSSTKRSSKSESEPDPEALKKLIINKYSFVDEEDEKREHRPAPIKSEPKKLIRYLDNKVVSVKGERYTQINDL
ncbi:CUE domain-containing protein 2-B-like [Artemia franciscana]|uniref:CUE domain-containing protein n=1 Tax=Artemia franciscana TaxID=6661 RepID=A0AA88L180_ARTSF|nr:hypothetical protein QYM36_009947 [Artemia franciscana]